LCAVSKLRIPDIVKLKDDFIHSKQLFVTQNLLFFLAGWVLTSRKAKMVLTPTNPFPLNPGEKLAHSCRKSKSLTEMNL